MFKKIVKLNAAIMPGKRFPLNFLQKLQTIWGVATPAEAEKILRTKILKSSGYDIRANVKPTSKDKAYLNPEVMEIIGHTFALTLFTDKTGKTFSLQPGDVLVGGYDTGETSKSLAEAFFKGITNAGINVCNVGLASSGQVYYNQNDFNAQAHVQITRSHVEVEINGAKFAVGLQGIHTFLLEQMTNTILENNPVTIPDKLGIIENVILTAEGKYNSRILAIYSNKLKANQIPVAINAFNGTATKYLKLSREIFGEKLQNIFGEYPTTGSNELLADPTRAEMLDKIGVTEYSNRNPQVLVFSNDLDSDRQSMSQSGKLYLGDEIGMILSAYKLQSVEKLKYKLIELDRFTPENQQTIIDIARTVYMDNRCTGALLNYVEQNGGLVIPHTKGHSLWKETINANMATLAELTGFTSVAEFVNATGYRDYQIEYSLHMFVTGNEDGIPRDDGIENTFLLVQILNELGIKDLEADFFSNLGRMFTTKEIRTGVASETKDVFTKTVNDTITGLFTDSARVTSIHDTFAGQVRVNFKEGFVMYSCSNTSPKVGFEVEGNTAKLRNNLLAFTLAIHNSLRNTDEKMDLKENEFFKKDISYDMQNPDDITADDARVAAACAFFGIKLPQMKAAIAEAKIRLEAQNRVSDKG